MKYKTLKIGKCYINKEGSFVICVLGKVKYGYDFAASHVHPSAILGIISTQSRIVENNGSWIEISKEIFNMASTYHAAGHVVNVGAKGSNERIFWPQLSVSSKKC